MSEQDNIFNTKQSRCRYHMYNFNSKDPFNAERITSICKKLNENGVDAKEMEERCETCPHFKSKFIEYPISVTKLDVQEFDGKLLYHDSVGRLAKVRPCGKEYGNKTYLGIFLGDIPHSPHISHNPETGVLQIRAHCNPAIFVPDLNRIVWGMESWWSIVESENDLEKEITDELIQSQWYMKITSLTRNNENGDLK